MFKINVMFNSEALLARLGPPWEGAMKGRKEAATWGRTVGKDRRYHLGVPQPHRTQPTPQLDRFCQDPGTDVPAPQDLCSKDVKNSSPTWNVPVLITGLIPNTPSPPCAPVLGTGP